MSGLSTALAALGWLVGLGLLVTFPIVSVGVVGVLMMWTWDPVGAVFGLLVTGAVSLGWREFGPSERVLARFPELAVALAAVMVAVLAGGQVAPLALAVLALDWFVWVRILRPTRHPAPAGPHHPIRRTVEASASPAPVAGFLGTAALRVDAGPCPFCGGLLVATGRTAHDPERGPLFLAEARCTTCGQHLVGIGDATTGGRITWLDPQDRREGIA